MSTSLLYQAFSIRGYEHVRPEHQGGNVVFTIQQAPKDLPVRSLRLAGLPASWAGGASVPVAPHRQSVHGCRLADPTCRLSGL
jgi:hypothetical protein